MNRVVVTGMGALTPIGHDVPAYIRALLDGRCAMAPPTLANAEKLSTKTVSSVTGFDPLRHFAAREVPKLDRVSQFAVVAAREAIAASGLVFDGGLGERTAAIVGTAVGGATTSDEEVAYPIYAEGASRLRPLAVPKQMMSAPVSQITMYCGIRGPSFAVASACAAGTHAIGLSFQLLRTGAVDCAVTGGTEACLTFGTLRAWEALRVMAPDACRPFSRDRKGIVLGEGAAMFVLETLDGARARGARIIAEIAGFGMSADAKDLVAPDEDGVVRAITGALNDARLNPADVQYVNAHGTGTSINDTTETAALKRSFGHHARRLAISSTKSMVGHALGAAGALELVATVHALAAGAIPPTAGYLGPDPACDLDYVPNDARNMPVAAALSNSFAFGGLNAVLAVRRFDG